MAAQKTQPKAKAHHRAKRHTAQSSLSLPAPKPQHVVIEVKQTGAPPMARSSRSKTKARRAQPGYGQRSAAHTGALGAASYRANNFAPKERQGPAIILVNPGNPNQGRLVKTGKRGGVYGQGGSAKSRWTDLAALKKITAALPAAGLLTAVGGAGMVMMRNNATVQNLAAKLPGGMNTVTLGAGVGIGWLAYKYKSLVVFLAGLGIGLYALLKFSTNEVSFETGDASENMLPPGGTPANPNDGSRSSTHESPGAAIDRAPKAKVGPSSDDQAKAAITAGNKAFAAGDYDTANNRYWDAWKAHKDSAILYNMARANHKKAEGLANSDITKARKVAADAKSNYEQFLALSARDGSTFVDGGQLATMRQKAQQFIKDITLYLSLDEGQAAEVITTATSTAPGEEPISEPGGGKGGGWTGNPIEGEVVSGDDDGIDDSGYPIGGDTLYAG